MQIAGMKAAALPLTHKDMLLQWPVRAWLVAQLNEAMAADGLVIRWSSVQSWEIRNSIPKKYWPFVARLAERAGYVGITEASLEASAVVYATGARRGRPWPPDRPKTPRRPRKRAAIPA